MSRFFHGSDTSSESSDDEESLYSGEEKEEKAAKESEEESTEEEDEDEESEGSTTDEEGGPRGVNRFLREVSDAEESSDEDRVTVVKSARDKSFEALEGTIRLIENAEKINDWAVIASGA